MPLDHLLPVCQLPTINFIIALYGVTGSVFQSQSSFSVQRILFNIPAVQQCLLQADDLVGPLFPLLPVLFLNFYL